MKAHENIISHPGIVQSVSEKVISVLILSKSACSSCTSQKSCTAAEMEEKIIEVEKPKSQTFTIGDTVTVSMRQSTGTWAILLGYVFPFVVLLFSIILFTQIEIEEGISGLLGLLVLGFYYLGLLGIRKKISSRFQFYIS